MNVLVTSISAKVPMLKTVKSAMNKLEEGGLLFGADIDHNCIGSFFVDRFWTIPRLDELTIEELVRYCHTYNITCIIPSRDGELTFFADNREMLRAQGIHVMVSDKTCVELCNDKLQFYRKLSELNFPAIPSFDRLSFDAEWYVVKERYGAGGLSAGIALDASEAIQHAARLACPIFQPYIEGTEVSVDVYVDAQGKTKGVIPRERIRVVNGESQITSTFWDQELEQLCSEMAECLGAYGHILFQLIQDNHGRWHILECNTRFGGASTLSVAAGLDSFYWFFLESAGIDLTEVPFFRSDRDLTLIRHAEDLIQ